MSVDKLNILVLHRLGDPDVSSAFLKNHVFALKNYFPENNYIYHDVDLSLPEYVRTAQFDVIVLDVTLLCARWAGEGEYMRIRQEYGFVRETTSVKIAFPQDEYDCSLLLDQWMCDWNVDVVYSVISEHWDVLYPEFSKRGEIRLGYTGYIDDSLADMVRKPFAQRQIDIGYRARKLLPYFGRIGEVKWSIGFDVETRALKYGLQTDIRLGQAGFLCGSDWLNFINNCKFTLGSNSGSSLMDPYGEIQGLVKAYVRKHPEALFDEVEAACFPGQEGKYAFTAISPRVLEAGMLDSCQILVEGSYSGIISPWQHYIPIKADASDFEDVYRAMSDTGLVAGLIRNCRESLLDTKALRASCAAANVIELIRELVASKQITTNGSEIVKLCRRYEVETLSQYRKLWRRKAIALQLANRLREYPWVFDMAKATRDQLRILHAFVSR
ncbi:hypothetical protein FE236_07855 [Mariprofundus erugo]|uniref:hypothetical protein n=1 Tax=Mariprofundus erugo TaxID=2528639 RepID=UPI0010FEE356|nr:hypothetical protein [Mariprofundus erugo]TLS76038.1 hypothetical protein FE236_07855 [Mariprofundus erugo]